MSIIWIPPVVSELDRHDDQVAATFLRLQRLISGNDSRTSTSSQEKALSRKLARVERRLAETVEALAGVTEDNKDILPLEQHKEQLDDVKESCHPSMKNSLRSICLMIIV